MYRGYEVLASSAFRVTRNSNLYFEEEEARSLLETIRVELHNRRKGDAVRLEIESNADPEIVERLRVNFELDEDQVFRGEGPVNLSRLMFLYGDIQRPDLKFQPFTPKPLTSAASPPASSTSCATATFCSTTPTTPTIRWSSSFSRARRIRPS
jgi:polyphosphate kinase